MASAILVIVLTLTTNNAVVNLDTAVSESVRAFLELLNITDEACNNISWCSFKKGGHQREGISPSFMEHWYGGCSCDEPCLANGICCPDYILSDAMSGEIYTDAAVLSAKILNNRTISSMNLTNQYETVPGETLSTVASLVSTETDDVSLDCVPSGQTGTRNGLALPSFRMVTSCSRSTVTDDFEHTIEDYIPVQSLTTGLVYRNKRCFMCSNEAGSEYRSWSIFVSSESVPVSLLKSYLLPYKDFIQKLLNQVWRVDLVFAPDEVLSKRFPLPVCFNIDVDTCANDNRTDFSLLQMSCKLHVSPVYTGPYDRYKIFKNMACYRCNDGWSKAHAEMCQFLAPEPSFVGMLRRQDKWMAESTDTRPFSTYRSTRCGEGNIYDPNKVIMIIRIQFHNYNNRCIM